jgi:hypothetical protein
MGSGPIFADEWQGLLGPFVLLLLGVVLVAGLVIGVGLGVGVAGTLRFCLRRKERCIGTSLRKLGRVAVLGCVGLLLGLVLVWLFRGDPFAGPMVTSGVTERAAFAMCFFIPFGVGAGVGAGMMWR